MSDPYAAALSGAAGRSLQLDQILGALLRQAPDVEAAAVVSFDGLPMASALPAGMDEDRVAAMSAALLSLGERAAQGLGRGDLSQVYVEGDNGTVFLVSADDEAVLVAVGRVGAKVGLMLFEVKQAAGAVGTALRIDVEPLPPLVNIAPEQQVQQIQQAVAQPVQAQPVQAQPVQVQPLQVQPEPVPQHASASDRQASGSESGNPEYREPQYRDNAEREETPSSADRFPHLTPVQPDDRRPAVVASDGSSWS
jgi:uncharacterized protein